jgi:hypothetical protein
MTSPGPPAQVSVRAMTEFVRSVPGADAVLAEHLRDNDEVLPHVLMADLRRWFVSAVEAGDDERIRRFLAGIEKLAASQDPDVRNVVELSFVHDLLQAADSCERAAVEAMRPLIGPATARALAASERST